MFAENALNRILNRLVIRPDSAHYANYNFRINAIVGFYESVDLRWFLWGHLSQKFYSNESDLPVARLMTPYGDPVHATPNIIPVVVHKAVHRSAKSCCKPLKTIARLLDSQS